MKLIRPRTSPSVSSSPAATAEPLSSPTANARSLGTKAVVEEGDHLPLSAALNDAIETIEALFSPLLTNRHVARILNCSIPAVRKIPTDELPRRKGLGKEHVYLRSDVAAYCRRLQTSNDS